MTGPDDRITARQAADLCGVVERTITRWAKAGKIRGHPSLTYRRYSRRELEEAGLVMDQQDAAGGLMSRSEVADLFRVHKSTVNSWVKAGALSPVRVVYRRRYYLTSDVMALARLDVGSE